MLHINVDLTCITSGLVCHQVNCKGVMGAGLAKAVRKKWPEVYTTYRECYNQNLLKLGNVIFVPINKSLVVANLCGQDYYGRKKRYTDYNALEICFKKIRNYKDSYEKINNKPLDIYIPHNMGCTLAGGNWQIVEKLLEMILPFAVIVRYV